MKVLKFGGTSVQDTESIKKLVKIVLDQLAEDKPIILVTSAMGGITNQLMAAAEKAENGEDSTAFIKEIEDRHLEVIHQLIPAKFQNPVIMRIKLFLNELEELLQGVSAIKELSPRTVDRILSYGELCSTSLVAGVLSQQVPQTEFIDTRQVFLTDEDYNKAKILLEETTQNIETLFDKVKADVYCVTGFIGANSDGRTTTLGRGGSDYTAAILGSVLEVDEIQIWTDVDGFMTADPR